MEGPMERKDNKLFVLEIWSEYKDRPDDGYTSALCSVLVALCIAQSATTIADGPKELLIVI